jgi:tRNA-2-methylthio-N6-dimethylallyladenosine synthase
MNYYLWTMGCQMNKAESSDIGNYLESLAMQRVNKAADAHIAILNTCVVRQNAEDKVTGMLGYLKGIKAERPDMKIVVTGCFVTEELPALRRAYPQVYFFFQPGEIGQFKDWVLHEYARHEMLIDRRQESAVSAYIPIIQGCNNYCSYCIVPYRRGRERSRKPGEILEQAQALIEGGAREIVLVGQNVNAYGKDLADKSSLGRLLQSLHGIADLKRIRFLTNHPKDMSEELISAIASLPKVCHHACLPLQAGDDLILKAMNRHYTVVDYKALIDRIRSAIPDMALSTDLIVGFPGESEEQFMNSYHAVEGIRFDAVHVASYSPRTGTAASREFEDNVDIDIKKRRLHAIEDLQRDILAQSNSRLVDTDVEILVEGQKGGKWYGRTYSDKLVFFNNDSNHMGKLVSVRVSSATPWALQGDISNY